MYLYYEGLCHFVNVTAVYVQFRAKIYLQPPAQSLSERDARSCNWYWISTIQIGSSHHQHILGTELTNTILGPLPLSLWKQHSCVFVSTPRDVVGLMGKCFYPQYMLCISEALLIHLLYLWTQCSCGVSMRHFTSTVLCITHICKKHVVWWQDFSERGLC